MGAFEIILAIVLALILFAVLKIVGALWKFALIVAALGFVVGLLRTRRKSATRISPVPEASNQA
jgi:membrane protease YdiL (CAAX protease family)